MIAVADKILSDQEKEMLKMYRKKMDISTKEHEQVRDAAV